ncbi:MAG: hypothetical protein GY716_12670 [bacterium]|nr:hypothetical protein [bacterium]
MPDTGWSSAQGAFAAAAVRRKKVFLALSIVGVAIGLGLGAFYLLQWTRRPDYPVGVRLVLVVLILLNARQNLRQYRFACLLEKPGPRS